MIWLLAQEDGPGLFRVLGPLVALIAIAVFGWISEKIKKKEREQQAEQDAGYRQEANARDGQAGPMQPSAHPVRQPPQRTQPRPAQPIHRYQPQIPASPASPDWRRPQSEEPEPVILAQDITAVASARQLHEQQRKRQLLIQAARRAKALKEAELRRRAAALRASQATEAAQTRAAAQAQAARSLHDGDIDTAQLVPASDVSPLEITVSPAQLRQAVVWAEILGPPRAIRDYSFSY